MNKYVQGLNCGSLEGVELIDELFEERDHKKNKNKKVKLEEAYGDCVIETPKVGDRITATYLGMMNNEYVLDFGFKDWLWIENKPNESKIFENLERGQEIEAIVSHYREHPFELKGSVAAIYERIAREQMLDAIKNNHVINAKVFELNPAGFMLSFDVSGITFYGFMPNTLSGINKLNDPKSLEGQIIEVMAESYSAEKGTYILSRKKYLKSLIYKEVQKLNKEEVYTGQVTGTTEYGVFVEFNGCLTGMIHKANINPAFQDKIKDIESGTEIDFYIKEILKDKIILTQIIRETLWDTIEEGQILEGKVREIKDFGVLVQLDDETRGLIHSNELKKVKNEPKVGEKVKVKVTDIDRSGRKVYLTII